MSSKLKGRAPEEVKPGRIKAVLFGAPGAGKTWTAIAFPAPFYIDVEEGASRAHYQKRLKESGGAYFGPKEGSLDFDSVIEQVDALATEKHGFRTLVIDSFSKLFWTLAAREQERLGAADAFGAYKKLPIQKSRKLIAHLDRLDMNTFLVCHEIAEWQNVGGERKEVGKQPDTGWDRIPYELDLVLQVRKLGPSQREAQVWKSRLLGFPDFDRFYLQNNGTDVTYSAFTERYAKDAIEAEVKPIVLASAEEVAEIERMLEIVKVPPDVQEKWFAKAGVDSFAEFTSEQAAGVIGFLGGKMAGPAKKAS